MCFLYHICREADKYNFNVGYIGVTETPEYRWLRHKKYEKNGRLKRVYLKYHDIIEYVILEGSREYCLFQETKLRPSKRLGWNLVEGGGDPPNLSGKIMSQSQKDKIGISNSGSNSANWKGWWVVEGVQYETLKEAAKSLGVVHKTVFNRVHSKKFPSWSFKEKADDDSDLSRL